MRFVHMIGLLVDLFMELTGLRRWSHKTGERIGRQWGERLGESIAPQTELGQKAQTPAAVDQNWYEIPSSKEALQARIEEQQLKLRELESEKGPNDIALAPVLDYLAALLKANNAVLDGANCRARAAAIRSRDAKKGIANDIELNAVPFSSRSAPRLPRLGRSGIMVAGAILFASVLGIVSTLSHRPGTGQKEALLETYARSGNESSVIEAIPLRYLNQDSPGEAVYVQSALIPGKTTIVYFHSAYCPSCNQMEPLVERLAGAKRDLNIVGVNINRDDATTIDFDSPVAEQFDVHSVPSFRIYSRDGELIAQDGPAKDMVRDLMRETGVAR